MANTDTAAVLSSAFRQLSDALHRVSTVCKDLEYIIPNLAAQSNTSSLVTPKTTTQGPAEKSKRTRDPNEPRRPPSSYLLFLSKARQDLAKTDPDLKPAEIMTKLAGMWNDLSDNQKQPYEEEAERLKQVYNREREQYEKDNPGAVKKRRRIAGHQQTTAAKTLPSPTASPAIEAQPPVTPSVTKSSGKDSKQQGKKDKTPKSDRKSKEKEKEKVKEKERKRKSDVK